MKIRQGFVSNSSSSSFVIVLNKITNNEIDLLKKYMNSKQNKDGWIITINDDSGLIEGSTSMCNGSFPEWAEKNGFNRIHFNDGW